MTVHMTPGHGDASTPCCDLSPLEMPYTDRLTLDTSSVTCAGTVELRPRRTTPARFTPLAGSSTAVGELTLEAFTDLRTPRQSSRIVRCACGHETCHGWAEVDADAPWGLRPWEAAPSFIGPLVPEHVDGGRNA